MSQFLSNELLQWLFRVLQPEYTDPRSTYHDIALLLQRYTTMKPRTRVYTFQSGHSSLLLNLYGSLPAVIGGKTYRIPVELWIPHEYPLAAPIAYVVPTEKMVLQPGNHVDTNGQCYLHYLSSWGKNGTNSAVELCDELSQVFAKEPPVFAKPVGRPVEPQPVLPPKVISPSPETAKNVTSPPPLPPFPHELRSQLIKSPTLNKMSEEQQMKPVFEQPNIMDTLIDDSKDDSHRLSVLNRVESMLQDLFDSDVHASLESFQRNSVQIKYAIGKFQKIFEYEFDNLKQLNDHIDQNELVLKRCILEANETINGANRVKDINIDEMICAETVVYNQLYDLVAEDQAIGDTIYALTKAHDNGNIPMASFIKHTRNLAREQFMKKALIVKISGMLDLQ